MRRSLLALVATLGAVAACGLITGVGDLTTSPDASDAGASPGTDGATLETGAEAGERVDAAVDAGDASKACTAPGPTPNKTGALSATRAKSPIVLDGLLDEWACTPFTRLDRASAAIVDAAQDAGTQAGFALDFAVVWDATAIYLAGHISNASLPGGAATVGIFKNDSIEVYFDGDGVLTGQGGTSDHQFMVDHANRTEDYRVTFPTMLPALPPATFTSVVVQTGSDIVFELRIAAAALGRANLAAGAKLGFDMAVNDVDGANARTQMIWFNAPGACTCVSGCCCGQSVDQPFCDTQRFGSLTLTP